MTIDYFPTLLEMTGTPSRDTVDGRSIVPLLHNVNATLDRNLYWHYPHYHAGGDGPYSAVRSGAFRLIEFHEDSRTVLYDLVTDIGEQTNLAITMPNKAIQLQNDLRRWRESVQAQMPTPNPDYDAKRATQVVR